MTALTIPSAPVPRLPAGRPMEVLEPAREMYARRRRLIAWDEVAWRRTVRLLRDLKANCAFDPKPDSVWDDARQFTTMSGRKALWLNCNGYAPLSRRLLHDGGFPMEAMALVICRRPHPRKPGEMQGHMVLALATDQGDYLVCNLLGLGRCDDPRWRAYQWVHKEVPGGGWQDLRPAKPKPAGSLADLMKGLG